MYEPYIVIGVGRTGTSSVARNLHEHMGISMGRKFIPADENNPQGTYEDFAIWFMNREFFRNDTIGFRTWSGSLEKYIESRKDENIPWGFKENRMAPYLGFIFGFFDAPRIIYCTRDKDLAVASMVRCWTRDKKFYDGFFDKKTQVIKRQLTGRNFLNIHFGKERMKDEEIQWKIRKHWMR